MINTEDEFWQKIQSIQTRSRRKSKLSENEAEELLEFFQVWRIEQSIASARKDILNHRKKTSCPVSTK
jgi:hypothetical protein